MPDQISYTPTIFFRTFIISLDTKNCQYKNINYYINIGVYSIEYVSFKGIIFIFLLLVEFMR